jgi:regulator of protease activity HflC (stomatin/prohibitin superfamily)
LPFHIDDILSENVVTKTIQTKPQSLITKDGQFITVSLIVTFHVDDIKTYMLDVENAKHVIEDASYGMTADFVMKHTWDELVEMDNTNNELTKFIRRRAGKFGVYVDAVQVMDFIKCAALRMIGIKNEQTTQHS